MNSGKTANKNGRILEQILIAIFENHNYKIINESDLKKEKDLEYFYLQNPKLIIKNASYKTIYDHWGKTEFLLKNSILNKLIRIECKWQQTAGSVDEKFPYLYLNCIYAFEEQEIIILIAGTGFKKGAIEWIKNKVENNWLNVKQKNIKIMDINEFTSWFNNLHK